MHPGLAAEPSPQGLQFLDLTATMRLTAPVNVTEPQDFLVTQSTQARREASCIIHSQGSKSLLWPSTMATGISVRGFRSCLLFSSGLQEKLVGEPWAGKDTTSPRAAPCHVPEHHSCFQDCWVLLCFLQSFMDLVSSEHKRA